MMYLVLTIISICVFGAWLKYRWIHRPQPDREKTVGLTDVEGPQPWGSHVHQSGVRWLHEIFERSAKLFPSLPALTVHATGHTLTYAQLDARAEQIADLISRTLSDKDQVVAVYMMQDHPDIVAAHLGILKAGGVQLFLDPESPRTVIMDMLRDARPALLLTRGESPSFDIPSIDLVSPHAFNDQGGGKKHQSTWLDDPSKRLASIFYTSGTSGRPKGVECPHSGYINLVKSYAAYFDFIPGQDATSLSSSLGYDGSISEMYSAWVAGCEVVMLTKPELRSGPDLLPILKEREVTALFCPPVLLSTLSSKPSIDLPYPICRYVIPAGEAFPASLVRPWSEGRRQIINTYGPTEASTDTSRQLLRPDEPVTIGTPFAGVSYLILSPRDLQPVPVGQEGELCIGGCQLARGYRNLEEVTAEKFVDHPDFGRLYRSGDRCHIDPDSGRVHFHGRLDTQLKVRGFRVETQPIESLLQDRFEEVETAVLDCQNDELIAFIKLPESSQISDSSSADVFLLRESWIDRVHQSLKKSFPDHAVPSRYFAVRKFNLVSASGKIDRKALPKISKSLELNENQIDLDSKNQHQTSESIDQEVLGICRSILGETLDPNDDFLDWGAHSISIAQLSQSLQFAGYPVTVRSLLSDTRTASAISKIPKQVFNSEAINADSEQAQPNHYAPDETLETARPIDFRRFSFLQAIGIVLLRLPTLFVVVLLLGFTDAESLLIQGNLFLFLMASALGFGVYLILPVINLSWIHVIRRVLSRSVNWDIEPGRYHKYSTIHLTVWFIEQQQNIVLQPMKNMVRSPVFFQWMMRCFGAHIARSAHISQSVEFSGPLAMLTLEPNAVIQSSAQVSTLRWEGNYLVIGKIKIGEASKVGTRATVVAGAEIGPCAWVTPLSSVDRPIPGQIMISGVPGEPEAAYQPLGRHKRCTDISSPTALTELRNVGLQIVLEMFLLVMPAGATAVISLEFLGFDAIETAMRTTGRFFSLDILSLFGFAVAGIWLSIVASSMVIALFLRFTPSRAGVMAVDSIPGVMARYRQQKMNQLQQFWTWSLTGQYLRALSGVRFSRIGGSECDAMTNLLPEHLNADADIFLAHGCFCNVLDEEGETLTLRTLRLPSAYFASNNSVSEHGNLPGNLLLGVSTPIAPYLFRQQSQIYPDPARVIAGNPPLVFGAGRNKPGGHTRRPSFFLFVSRFLLSDLGSAGVIPGTAIFLGVGLLVWTESFGWSEILTTGLAAILFTLVLPLLALLVKLVLVGSRWGRDHSTPFWSVRHFTYFLAQDCFFQWSGMFLTSAAGTALANPLLRIYGCRIGKQTLFANPIQVFDWHAADIGNGCVINGQLQLHSFEERVLTVQRSRIGDHTCFNHGAMLMGGADIESNVTIEAQALVLKGMRLKTGRHQGSPSQRLGY